ncbi:RluA family pseudouridine synthase [Patescibacteria group bacterium]|nr:RluA family pseudouridine synthase [Patescibacteria group bacterium]
MNKIKIIFEDDDLLVLDKPAGVTVNRSETTRYQITVQDFTDKHINFPKDSDPESDFIKRSGIVHRLDKETSGILLVAKKEAAFKELQRQFKDREVKKTYLALAHGRIIPEEGEIRAAVGRLPWNRKRFGVLAGGRESVTRYKVIHNYQSTILNKKEDLTLVELYPETGRTHQIRVHLKYINRPIFADELYAGRKVSREDRRHLERVFLHAAKISFKHPVIGKPVEFISDLPLELENLLKQIK